METLRKVVAAIVGIIIIIAIILLAKWLGDRIREKFFAPKPTVVVKQTQPVPAPTITDQTATYSAIPSTGPADFGYFLIALMLLSGFSIKLLDRTI